VDDESHSKRDQNQKTKFVEGPKREDKQFKFKNLVSSIFFMSFFLHFHLSRTPSLFLIPTSSISAKNLQTDPVKFS
jgi:hypothetical protein